MLTLPDSWTWDFWFADTGDAYHVFFLRASRALKDPHRRHWRAAIGHAVSDDLRHWTVLPDALVHADPPAFDDMATWTGSVLRGPDGVWRMFYTGLSHADDGTVQRIGMATSEDLLTWHSHPQAVLEADQRWYEKHGGQWRQEAWRDPWVFPDADGDGWHMLITARANHGPSLQRGVIGHARSRDLDHWEAQPPLSQPNAGFGQLEVLQVEVVAGQPVLVFSCLAEDMAPGRNLTGGTWALVADSPLGPFDIRQAQPLTDHDLYSGRLIQDRQGRWVLLGFHNRDERGGFVGELSDPIPVEWTDDAEGRPRLTTAPSAEEVSRPETEHAAS
jgi:beta-fructofuranosidase